MSTIWTFDGIENNHNVYRGEDCTKKFCKSLREHSVKITNFEKNKMIPLTDEEYESYLNNINCHICNGILNIYALMIKIIVKLRTIVIILVNTEALHIAY